MKKMIIAASIIAGCSFYVLADTSGSADCSQNCPQGNENCVCVPTPDGGCVCVPGSGDMAASKPVEKNKSICPNTSGCICE